MPTEVFWVFLVSSTCALLLAVARIAYKSKCKEIKCCCLMFYVWGFNVDTFGIILIALFCDLAVLLIGSDWQHPGLVPTKPDLKKLLKFSLIFGLVLFIQGMWWYLFLAYSFNYKSYKQQGVEQVGGLPVFTGMSQEEQKASKDSVINLSSAMFLEMGLSALMAVFPARTKGPFFLSCISPKVLIPVLLFCGVTTIIIFPGIVNPLMPVIVDLPGQPAKPVVGWTWLYCIIFMFILDLAKMCTYLATEPKVYRSQQTEDGGCRCHCWGLENICKPDEHHTDESAATDAKKKVAGPGLQHSTSQASFAPIFDDNLRG